MLAALPPDLPVTLCVYTTASRFPSPIPPGAAPHDAAVHVLTPDEAVLLMTYQEQGEAPGA